MPASDALGRQFQAPRPIEPEDIRSVWDDQAAPTQGDDAADSGTSDDAAGHGDK